MPITYEEWMGLVLTLLLVMIYWIKDRLLYNRADKGLREATMIQFQVLFLLAPLWIFSTFVKGLQQARGQPIALLTKAGTHIVSHYSTVGILNDSSRCRGSRSQASASASSTVMWTIYALLMFGSENVNQVTTLITLDTHVTAHAVSKMMGDHQIVHFESDSRIVITRRTSGTVITMRRTCRCKTWSYWMASLSSSLVVIFFVSLAQSHRWH